MMRVLSSLLAAVTLLAATHLLITERDQRLRMRDGMHLSTNVFRPATKQRVPAILFRTPYNKKDTVPPGWGVFLDAGFAVVTQDVRGRGDSDGQFGNLRDEGPDGVATIDWIASQPWSNGCVAMLGGSYTGIVQYRAALAGSKHLCAIAPTVAGWDEYTDRYYSRGGALRLGHRLLWLAENMRRPGYFETFARYTKTLPLREADRAATGRRLDLWQDVLSHPVPDSFWQTISTRDHIREITIPTFIVGGWYDNYVQSDLEAFAALQKLGVPVRAVIGPWAHNMSARFDGVDFGPDAQAPLRKLQIDWFRRYLTKELPTSAPPRPLRLFVMGANVWRDETAWPPPDAQPVPFYLSSSGHANSRRGDGSLQIPAPHEAGSDRFVYDPANPVPTRGGNVCCDPKFFPWGPLDQSTVEDRSDVLVYSSPPLPHDVEMAGPVTLDVWMSTSAVDTDLTAKLVNVDRFSKPRILADGILRLRYRDGHRKLVPAKPGDVYRVTVDLGATAALFRAGERIRLEISSSNFPRFDRNLNLGLGPDSADMTSAHQTIFHGGPMPSRLLLPIRRSSAATLARWTRPAPPSAPSIVRRQ